MIEEIKYKKKILAYIIKYKKKNGTNFLTPERLTYQIAFIKHKKNPPPPAPNNFPPIAPDFFPIL